MTFDDPDKLLVVDGGCLYDGPALSVPPGQRIRPKRMARFDDPVIPRSYWYWTAGLATAALALGLLLGRFLLG
jgi:hypothetical protein